MHARWSTRLVALLAAAALATAACRPHPGTIHVDEGGFGYASAGMLAHADFYGEYRGIGGGQGASLTLPIPPWLFAYVAAIVVTEGDVDLQLEVEGDPKDVFASGFVAPERKISEFSINLTVSSSHHDDDLGGELDYSAVLLGARLAGSRSRAARIYFDAGYGWYVLDFTSSPHADADIGGPYIGGGLEVFLADLVSLGLAVHTHFYFGEDVAGDLVDGGARQIGLVLTAYW